jgi:hypothetical protein
MLDSPQEDDLITVQCPSGTYDCRLVMNFFFECKTYALLVPVEAQENQDALILRWDKTGQSLEDIKNEEEFERAHSYVNKIIEADAAEDESLLPEHILADMEGNTFRCRSAVGFYLEPCSYVLLVNPVEIKSGNIRVCNEAEDSGDDSALVVMRLTDDGRIQTIEDDAEFEQVMTYVEEIMEGMEEGEAIDQEIERN